MKKKLSIFLTFLFVLFFINGFSQVDHIKSGSDKNASTKGNGHSETQHTSSGSSPGDGCLSGCFDACGSQCFQSMFEVLIVGGLHLHSDYLKKRHDIPTVVSVDFMPHFGFNPPSCMLMLPRIRGNWGLFSTDFRLNNMMELGTGHGVKFYRTLDWQILELNLIVTEPITARIGSGFMYEKYSNTYFSESYIGLDWYMKKNLYLTTAEFRIAKDYETGATPRAEGNLRFNYKVLDNKNLYGYVTAGCIYQNYYNSVDLWTAQVGLTFNFH